MRLKKWRHALARCGVYWLLPRQRWRGRLGAPTNPFWSTYSHQMEGPGNLEIETKKTVTGRPNDGNRSLGSTMGLEYSVTGPTDNLGARCRTTSGQSTIFTGYRWEDRFRLFRRNHWINPVVYAEYAELDCVDNTSVEVVGRAGKGDLIQLYKNA